MANRIPTYVDATSEKISEVPAGDFLSIEGSGLAEGYTVLTGATPSISLSSGGAFSLTLSGNTTVSFTGAPATGTSGFSLKVKQDAGGSGFTVTWPASVQWPGGTAPALTATADKSDVFVFTTDDGGSSFVGLVAGKDI
ncbi:MAG: hypothetical protein P8J32_04430 [bacterium]|nr:hypothetical protein [bacterium]